MKTIKLTQGRMAIVDDDDYERLQQWKWCCSGNGYVIRHRPGHESVILMHREVLGTPDGIDTDHINGNKLDNRKENLRFCNGSQNMANQGKLSNNTSGYKGVTWDKLNKKWKSQIKVYGINIHLGRFINVEDAANAYKEAAIKYFGEFARI